MSTKTRLVWLTILIFSTISVLCFGIDMYFYILNYDNKEALNMQTVGTVFCIGLLCIMIAVLFSKLYFKLKEKDVYDEFGRRKKQSMYKLDSKERQAIEIQQFANVERILSKSAIEKACHKGSANPLDDLNKMIGLSEVKTKIQEMEARMAFEKHSKKDRSGLLEPRHMIFFGSPGTGKTTVARIVTGILYKYKYIKKNSCLEIDGNFLKAGNGEDTNIKVRLLVQAAKGGVLFVDEAYSLTQSGDEAGTQAVATLIKEMEDHAGEFVLILAGYTNEMSQMLDTNPGFRSRIREYISFPDYSESELREIFMSMAGQKGFAIQSEAYELFDTRVSKEKGLSSWGNARTVRNILQEAVDKHAYNFQTGALSKEEKYLITAKDISTKISARI